MGEVASAAGELLHERGQTGETLFMHAGAVEIGAAVRPHPPARSPSAIAARIRSTSAGFTR
jgi:hypothetical protein